jgi:putative transposase
LPRSIEQKRSLIEPEHPDLSIRQQCELIDLCRASYYLPPAVETAENLALMRRLDELHLWHPYYGSRRLAHVLSTPRQPINRKRVRRLMQVMGIEALYPKPRTTHRDQNHKIYPYLLRNLEIVRPNQVWSADITYVPMPAGFMYLVAVIDWFSRFVLAWELSNTLDGTFCVAAIEAARRWGLPEIFNSDQGVQFTSKAMTDRWESWGVAISMDGRGRALDNVFIERLWRSVKQESIYRHAFDTVPALEQGLDEYFQFYCHERPHQSLDYRKPAEVYGERRPNGKKQSINRARFSVRDQS